MPKRTLYLIVGLVVVAVAALAIGANSELFQGALRKATLDRNTTTQRMTTTDTSRTTVKEMFSAESVALDTSIERDGLIDAAALKINTSSSIDNLRFQVDALGLKIRRFYVFLDGNDVTLKLSDASRLAIEQGLDGGTKSFTLGFAPSLKVKAGAMLKIRADLYDVGNEAGETLSVKILDARVSGQLYTLGNITYFYNVGQTAIEADTAGFIEASAVEMGTVDYVAPYVIKTDSAEFVETSTVEMSTVEYVAPSVIEADTVDYTQTR